MDEQLLGRQDGVLRWNGRKRGATVLTASPGALLLTTRRLVFDSPRRRGAWEAALGEIEVVELTGTTFPCLTVGTRRGDGQPSWVTFGPQQLGMPDGPEWVRAIERARSALLGGSSESRQDPAWTQASADPAWVDFRSRGMAPDLLGWRMIGRMADDVVPRSVGTAEVWVDLQAGPPISYLHAVAAFDARGTLRGLVTAETMPELHDSCYLGLFVDGVHHNLGGSPDHADLQTFLPRAVDVALEVLGHAGEGGPASAHPPQREIEELEAEAPREAELVDLTWLARHLTELEGALGRYEELESARALVGAAARDVADPEALDAAGEALLDADLPRLALAPLTCAMAARPRTSTLDQLVRALYLAAGARTALDLLLRHSWALEDSETTRMLAADIAALAGDLDTLGRVVAMLGDDGDAGVVRSSAMDRLARAAALEPVASRDLRYWDLVLHGMLLLRPSPFGEEQMNGRFAALWDHPDSFTLVLDRMEAALDAAGRRPDVILAAPGRDAEIFAWALAHRLGIGDVGGPFDTAPDDRTTLLAAYSWSDAHGVAHRRAAEPDLVLAAYSLDWTRTWSFAPDLVGVEAQILVPAWGERMVTPDLTGGDTPPGERAEPVVVPADPRPSRVIGTELAERPPTTDPAEAAEVAAIRDAVDHLHRVPAAIGLLRGRRAPYRRGGPVPSHHF